MGAGTQVGSPLIHHTKTPGVRGAVGNRFAGQVVLEEDMDQARRMEEVGGGGALGLALKEMERLREVAWSSSIWFKAEPP